MEQYVEPEPLWVINDWSPQHLTPKTSTIHPQISILPVINNFLFTVKPVLDFMRSIYRRSFYVNSYPQTVPEAQPAVLLHLTRVDASDPLCIFWVLSWNLLEIYA